MIDPIAFTLGPLAVRWYGLSYGVALLVGVVLLARLNRKQKVFKNNEQIFDFAFWLFLIGVIVGGRLGYVLFYNFSYYLQNPLDILAVWKGGMSFHGGLLASALAAYFYCKKKKIHFLSLADLAVIPGSLVLMFTRLANFINRELIGRPIENPAWNWLGVDFGDGVLRYPSQLFQSADALVLFLILLFLFSRKPKKGVLLFSYLALSGLFRFIIEFWRSPDAQIGFIWNYFTMGQVLSAITMIVGAAGLGWILRKNKAQKS